MSLHVRDLRKRGFTLLELLVVIAIIGILASMLFPAIQNALLKGKALKAGNAMGSKGIQGQIFAESLEFDAHGKPQLFPGEAGSDVDYSGQTSTDYFEDLLLDGLTVDGAADPAFRISGVDFTFFSLPGKDATPAIGSISNATFEAENNGWCVTLGLDTESNPNIPLFFTKNINIGDDLSTLNEADSIDEDVDILGNKMAIVIYAQGAVRIFEKEKFLDNDSFNPTGAQNPVIKPE